MNPSAFGDRNYMQMAWVVEDMEAAIKHWTERAGVGPFFTLDHVAMDDIRHRGEPSDIDISMALAQAGNTQIELIKQHGAAPSAFRDIFAPGETGFHHVAVICDDYDAELQAYLDQGASVAHSGSFGGYRFCYVDTWKEIGAMVELLERNEAQMGLFAMIREAGDNWDGSDPVRSLG